MSALACLASSHNSKLTEFISVGGYSQLQAGPAAYNLVATRESAERIVHGLSSRGLLGKGDTEESEREKVKIHGGFYSCLENESD